MKTRDELFRQWYDARLGVKSESFAYDVWCAAWGLSRQTHDAESVVSNPTGLKVPGVRIPDTVCLCKHPAICDLNDRCMKGEISE